MDGNLLLSNSGVVQPVSENFFPHHLREGHGYGDEPQPVESHFHGGATDLVDLHLDLVLLVLQLVDRRLVRLQCRQLVAQHAQREETEQHTLHEQTQHVQHVIFIATGTTDTQKFSGQQ